MKRKGKILSCALSFLLAVGSLTAGAGAAENKGGTMRDMTSQEILEDIRIGINIGNTFDARGDEIDARHGSVEEYERYWSGATITRASSGDGRQRLQSNPSARNLGTAHGRKQRH